MKLLKHCSFLVVLLITSGCMFSRPKNGPPTVKEFADFLEAVTNGTPSDQIPYINGALPTDFLHVTPWDVRIYVVENPLDDKYVALYRQVPAGILMHVTESDYELVPAIVETSGDSYMGGLTIFFDSEKRYKGYYAWSDFRRFKDSPARFELEKRQFIEQGLVNESKYSQSHITFDSRKMRPLLHSLPLDKSARP